MNVISVFELVTMYYSGGGLFNGTTMVQNLFCEMCKRYEDHLQDLRNYSPVWITGSRNLKASNLINHASGDQHKAAMRCLAVDTAKAENQPQMPYLLLPLDNKYQISASS